MAGITLTQAETQLALWIAADAAVATSQSYEIETSGTRRKLTRADALEIRNNIDYWQDKVVELTAVESGGRRRTRYVVPE